MSEPNLVILAGGISSRMKKQIELQSDIDRKL
jgi:molybdopterin-guanine dinucleotide biosynthesis protein A